MNSIKKSLYESYKAAAEMVIPDLKSSDFLKTGMLTKEEFTLSGDKLIENDPNWIWEKPGECLLKKRILCNKIQLEEDANASSDINIYSLKNENLKNEDSVQLQITKSSTEVDNEVDDFLDGFEDNNLIANDDATIWTEYDTSKHYYNVSITYDQYYRTPRIWFEGLNAHGELLTQEEIYSDFMIEYIKVSLTLEIHPLFDINTISVHPCKHAFAMQKMFAFELEKKDANEVKIEDYLVHFMKFASCVIPQLEFDHSRVK